MKNKVLIIEDDFCRFFSTKQVLETKLKLDIRVIGAKDTDELYEKTLSYQPHTVVIKPKGGVAAILEKFKTKRINKINSEVTFLVAGEVKRDFFANVKEFGQNSDHYPLARMRRLAA